MTKLLFVLDAQSQLNPAETDVLRQSIDYRRSLVALHRAACRPCAAWKCSEPTAEVSLLGWPGVSVRLPD